VDNNKGHLQETYKNIKLNKTMNMISLIIIIVIIINIINNHKKPSRPKSSQSHYYWIQPHNILAEDSNAVI
jgi:hypothetical protein